MTSQHTIRNHSLRESERGLPPGRWVTRGAIKVFEPDQPALEFSPDPWPTIKLCPTCETAYKLGQSCPTCLEWATRDAEQWAWQQARFANRHVVWAILDARKSVAA